MSSAPTRSSGSHRFSLASKLRGTADAGFALLGLLAYLLTGRSSRLAFHAMRRAYGPTGGWLNRAAHKAAIRVRPWRTQDLPSGFLGAWTREEIDSLANSIARQGYARLDRVVPADLCDDLIRHARSAECTPLGGSPAASYPESAPAALRYDFSESTALRVPAACRIAFDGTLAAIAGAYFGCRPIYDFSAMWWTTGAGERKLSEAAQQFHFDMDRLHFLKFFIYLTEVRAENGPHVFVAGSHVDKPAALATPTRFNDAVVAAHYPPESVVEIVGPVGSIFAVDTRGIHKGMPVVAGQRLVFQVEFAISKFGQSYPVPAIDPAVLSRAGLPSRLDHSVVPHILYDTGEKEHAR